MICKTKFITLLKSLNLVFLLFCFHNGFSQNNDDKIHHDVIYNVLNRQYEKAIAILENNINVVSNDTTGLFNALINLYLFEKRWSSIVKVYSLRSNKLETDTSVLSLARYYSKLQREEIIFNSIENLHYKKSMTGTPLIEVNINGKKQHFWFDTGCGITVISSSIAKECNVKQNVSISAFAKAGTGNRIKTAPGLIDSLAINKLNVYNHPCMIFDNKALEIRVLGIRLMKIDGIIGWNLIQELDVTINDKTKELTLAPFNTMNETGVNFFWSGKPIISCTDSAGNKLLYFIDTGARKAGLYKPYLTKSDTTNAKITNKTFGSAGGIKKIKTYIFSQVKINAGGQTLVLENVPVHPDINDSNLIDIDGVLGMKEIKKRVIHFNMRQGYFSISNL